MRRAARHAGPAERRIGGLVRRWRRPRVGTDTRIARRGVRSSMSPRPLDLPHAAGAVTDRRRPRRGAGSRARRRSASRRPQSRSTPLRENSLIAPPPLPVMSHERCHGRLQFVSKCNICGNESDRVTSSGSAAVIASRMAAMPTRILVVEDDPDIAELVARYLDKAGFVDRTRGAPAARRCTRSRHGRPICSCSI